jgi:hypothetical protein
MPLENVRPLCALGENLISPERILQHLTDAAEARRSAKG